MSRLALFLLGSPQVERDGRPVKIERRKALALIAYLAMAEPSLEGGSYLRDALATLLWPELDRAHSRAALRKALFILKQAVGEDQLEIGRESVALKRGADFWLDVDQFHSLLAAYREHRHGSGCVCAKCLNGLTEAVALYRDDFMAGFTLRDSPGFEEWQFFQAEELRREVSGALEKLVHTCSARQEYETAITHARRWLALDPLHEPAHCHLMELYALTDRRAAALRQYRQCVQVLERELGVLPEEETTRLYQAIRRNQEVLAVAPVSSPLVRSRNLPPQPTPFVGREEELAEIDRLLARPECRLLTLVGVGGVGKTRLALQAAERVEPFSDGVTFVSLASLSSAALLASAIADALRFSLQGAVDPHEQLLNYLCEKEMLLVLDNFEHLLPPAHEAGERGVQLLVEILERASRVKLLVTSRERLNLRWEWPFEVQGLSFPADDEFDIVRDALMGYSAVRLFLENACRVQPGFELTTEKMPLVARICRFLEGLPLGIELATTWLPMLSCRQIAQRIEQELDTLAARSRDVSERHRSLRAVFDDSWDLLSDEERGVSRRLSVFRGGFRGEAAAERVAGASPPLLLVLMHKSFLRRSPSGRYEMLEILRQYVEEKLLQDSEERDRARDLHCKYYAEFLHQQEEHLKGKDQQKALEEIREEIGNVRAAWQWAVAHGKLEQVNKSLESLCRFHEMRSWFLEGENLLRAAADRLRQISAVADAHDVQRVDTTRARVLAWQGRLCIPFSRFEEARELSQASLDAFRRLDMRQEMTLSLSNLGLIAYCLGEYMEAKGYYEESLALYEEIGDQYGMARSLSHLGVIASQQGECTRAQRFCQESLAMFKAIGNRWEAARCLGNMGVAAAIRGEYAEAKRLYQESQTVFEEIGDQHAVAKSYYNMGFAARSLGEHGEAEQLYRESLAIAKALGDRWGIASILNGLGFALSDHGEDEAAKECFCKALAIALDLQVYPLICEALVGTAMLLSQEGHKESAAEIGGHLLYHYPTHDPKARSMVEDLLSELATQLPHEAFAQAEARGKARTIEDFVRMVVE